jgi:dihydrofolate reductase
MILSLIAAMARNRVIGNHNAIPWRIPSDQIQFRARTMGHAVLLGRVTYEAIGRPLPGRKTIVLTSQQQYHAAGILVVHSLEEALAAATGDEELFIGGGGMVYHETIHLADRIYLSIIGKDFEGDTWFPEIPDLFREVAREEMIDVIPYAIVQYERDGRFPASSAGGSRGIPGRRIDAGP